MSENSSNKNPYVFRSTMSIVDADDNSSDDEEWRSRSSIYPKERVFTLIISKKDKKDEIQTVPKRDLHFKFSYMKSTISDIPPLKKTVQQTEKKNILQFDNQNIQIIPEEKQYSYSSFQYDQMEEEDLLQSEPENEEIKSQSTYSEFEEEEFNQKFNEEEEIRKEQDFTLKLQDLEDYSITEEEDEIEEIPKKVNEKQEKINTTDKEIEDDATDKTFEEPIQEKNKPIPKKLEISQNINYLEAKSKEPAKTKIPETKSVIKNNVEFSNVDSFETTQDSIQNQSVTRSKLVIHSKIYTGTKSTIEIPTQEPEKRRRPSQRPELKHRASTLC